MAAAFEGWAKSARYAAEFQDLSEKLAIKFMHDSGLFQEDHEIEALVISGDAKDIPSLDIYHREQHTDQSLRTNLPIDRYNYLDHIKVSLADPARLSDLPDYLLEKVSALSNVKF